MFAGTGMEAKASCEGNVVHICRSDLQKLETDFDTNCDPADETVYHVYNC